MVLAALQGSPVEVWLFGSWARGEQRRSSDIDVAVLPQADLPVGTLARLRYELDESTIPYSVDLVDLRDASVGFSRSVRAAGVPWTT